MEATGGNKSEAARRLGITRKTLHKKLKAFTLVELLVLAVVRTLAPVLVAIRALVRAPAGVPVPGSRWVSPASPVPQSVPLGVVIGWGLSCNPPATTRPTINLPT